MSEMVHLNPFERVLFALAVGVGGLVVIVRLSAIAFTWYLHHTH